MTQKLITLNHTLDSYFDIKKCDFVNVKDNVKNNVTEIVVFCNNLKVLIEYVKGNTQLEQVHLKFGVEVSLKSVFRFSQMTNQIVKVTSPFNTLITKVLQPKSLRILEPKTCFYWGWRHIRKKIMIIF